jgi:hypothetical protein
VWSFDALLDVITVAPLFGGEPCKLNAVDP